MFDPITHMNRAVDRDVCVVYIGSSNDKLPYPYFSAERPAPRRFMCDPLSGRVREISLTLYAVLPFKSFAAGELDASFWMHMTRSKEQLLQLKPHVALHAVQGYDKRRIHFHLALRIIEISESRRSSSAEFTEDEKKTILRLYLWSQSQVIETSVELKKDDEPAVGMPEDQFFGHGDDQADEAMRNTYRELEKQYPFISAHGFLGEKKSKCMISRRSRCVLHA